MTENMENGLYEQTKSVIRELLDRAQRKPGELFVVGCSSSEVTGGVIGHNSVPEAAEEICRAVTEELAKQGLYLCAQCCEHLNRAIIMEREAAEKYGYEPVAVVPYPKAGGSFAAAAYHTMKDPVAVEAVRAHAGIDIGGTLIGMHLRPVAVPVRLSRDHIGKAIILCAVTRPKYIGGSRAHYE